MRDIGVNTDELPPEELKRIVENNQELIELMEEENKDNEEHQSRLRLQNELQKELSEKNQIYELLLKSNNELKSKIDISNKKYQEILKKIEEKKQDNIEQKLILQIKELEKEISANKTETERYKKLIDQLKNKLDFKINLEKSSNFSRILKEETIRNSELKKELNSLTRLNKVQNIYIKNYDKDNQITNKINILKQEIQQTKNTIKDYQTKYIKLDKFIKLIHEKIISIEMIIKKEQQNKEEPKKKAFTREELKDTLDLINDLKNKITDKRNQLNYLTKQNDIKIRKMEAQNSQIVADFKENEKLNKLLIFKRNELKRNIKENNVKGVNNKSNLVKNKYKLNTNKNNFKNNNINNNEIQNNENNLENELENEAEFKEPENNENNDIEQNDEQQKLFGKNPNKINQDNNNEIQNINDGENPGDENMEQDNDAVENGNINDSNLNPDENNGNNEIDEY